jgi:putative pyruvate formate lyase activating enzyme
MFIPSYIKLYETGELKERADKLEAMLESCNICPKDCKVNRLKDEIAACYSGYLPIVSSYVPHFGEEPALVGTRGVGNIFFGNCNLRCVYCQNYQISQNWREERKNTVSFERLAEMMLELQEKGCHQIGFVSPTHFVPQIVRSVLIAAQKGLRLPLIYNTNTYDSVEVLKLLDGIIDIYLPDMKYSDDPAGYQYSKIRNYVHYSRLALQEMHRQVGSELVHGEDGTIKRGLIIRHLILPNDMAGSEDTLRFVSSDLDKNVTMSIMAQYYPTHQALKIPILSRKIRERELEKVLELMEKFEMESGWAQEFEAENFYRPDFKDRNEPFTDRQAMETVLENSRQ